MLSISSCAYWPSVCLLWKNVYLGPRPGPLPSEALSGHVGPGGVGGSEVGRKSRGEQGGTPRDRRIGEMWLALPLPTWALASLQRSGA